MQAMLVRETYRGVSCRHCGQPIRVRPSIVNRESAFQQSEPNFTKQWCSQVFAHRCRTCGAEAIYTLSHIVDFEGENTT